MYTLMDGILFDNEELGRVKCKWKENMKVSFR
jgi:hypothetical protein